MARKVTVIPASPTGGSKAIVANGTKTRVAAYCRVSTDHEEQEGSFKNQVDYYTTNRNGNWRAYSRMTEYLEPAQKSAAASRT